MGLPVLRYVFAVATVVMLAIGPLASAASVEDIDTLKMGSPSLTSSLEAVPSTEARHLRGLKAADPNEEERLSLSSIKNALGVKKTPPEVKKAQEALKLAEAQAKLKENLVNDKFIVKTFEQALKDFNKALKRRDEENAIRFVPDSLKSLVDKAAGDKAYMHKAFWAMIGKVSPDSVYMALKIPNTKIQQHLDFYNSYAAFFKRQSNVGA